MASGPRLLVLVACDVLAAEVDTVAKSKSARRNVRLRPHGQLTPVDRGDALVTVSVGPHNEAIAMWSTASGRRALQARKTQPGWASFPDPTTDAGVPVHVATYAPQLTSAVRIADLTLAHCHVQPLPEGRILVVGSRCRWRPEGADRNAIIVDPDGTVTRRGALGDGIEHVLATASGKIWVGYFDEGVYGNFGWGGPGPAPIGATGIVRFTEILHPEWHFPTDDLDPIDDCYALNVAGETAWSSYYSGFPVVRIENTVRSWPGSGSAANALITDGTRCALVGGYREHHGRMLVGDLDEGHFKPYRLTLPDDRPLPDRARIVGRGADLHVFIDSAWYRLNLADLP